MYSPLEVGQLLQSTLAERAKAHGVPAAAVAVVVDGEIVEHAVGVLSTATKVEATTDSVFQIGSITKVWTATLVMQLVDEGLVELDAPVRQYLPEFALADDAVAAAITVRQLLSHRSGIEGDIFTDTGRGDDAISTYLTLLSDAGQIFPPGSFFSYSNAGYVVLGRLVERVRDTTWEQALVERIATPLGLHTVSPSPYEAILHRAAVGHVGPDADGVAQPAPFWAMARSNEPAGSMLAMSARDLAAFAQAHLRAAAGSSAAGSSAAGTSAGEAPEGSDVLSQDAALAMRTTEVRLPRLAGMGAAWGLGWEIDREGDGMLFGHDGNTIGQSSFLRIAPDAEAAVVLLTNGGDGAGLFHDVVDELLRGLADISLPAPPTPPAASDADENADVDSFLGVYANSTVEMEVSQDAEGRLWLEQRPTPELVALGAEPSTDELVRYDEGSLILRENKDGMHLVLAFLEPAADGRASYIHFGRAVPRSR
ncbi:serine hydrolase [Microbacterium sp. W4I20]|uniref:serine hydrolase domain-containing protein n=1 Tax=Microbacterium sp. W4I20 TaxID=3042262 RepID=UPI0027858284|nr:serine hydrolase domain-containing protein [Microbacterium sp. W4I20]MDQ0728210.1 CubicO group peptidase (beta-lactamase class C family) [Microbacterium sp. W4I20]